MRIKEGKTTYKFPPVGKLIRAFMDENSRGAPGLLTAVEIMSADDFARLPEAKKGRPQRCALINRFLCVWPPPAEDGRLRVRYYPPAREA